MLTGLPTERSVLNERPLQDIYDEIRDVYKRYPQPWVIGYSGGKDSTTVLQLVWNAITLQFDESQLDSTIGGY